MLLLFLKFTVIWCTVKILDTLVWQTGNEYVKWNKNRCYRNLRDVTHTDTGQKALQVEISSSFILPFAPLTPSSLRVRLSLATRFTSWLSFHFFCCLLMTVVIPEMSCRTSLDSVKCVGLMSWTHSSRLLLAEPDPPPHLTPQPQMSFFYLIIQAIFWRKETGRKTKNKTRLVHPAYKGSRSSM